MFHGWSRNDESRIARTSNLLFSVNVESQRQMCCMAIPCDDSLPIVVLSFQPLVDRQRPGLVRLPSTPSFRAHNPWRWLGGRINRGYLLPPIYIAADASGIGSTARLVVMKGGGKQRVESRLRLSIPALSVSSKLSSRRLVVFVSHTVVTDRRRSPRRTAGRRSPVMIKCSCTSHNDNCSSIITPCTNASL